MMIDAEARAELEKLAAGWRRRYAELRKRMVQASASAAVLDCTIDLERVLARAADSEPVPPHRSECACCGVIREVVAAPPRWLCLECAPDAEG